MLKLNISLVLLLLLSNFSYGVPVQNAGVSINKLKITQRTGANRFKDNNGRMLRNHRLAGKTVFIKDIAPKLSFKYRKPIKFNKFGYPDFSKYSKKNIKTLKLTGNHQKDVRIVEKILKQKHPKWRKRMGYTWHHHQDGKTMQYVPTDLHSAIPHSGGASRLRVFNKNSKIKK